MKKILISGACGYIGARLSMFLAERGYKITAFDHFPPPENHPWSNFMDEIVIGDIREEAVLDNLSKRQFDAAINLISLDHKRSEQNPGYVASINVLPTWNLLDNLISNGLELFIYFSTQQTLGKIPFETIDESFSPNPVNKYGLSHLLSEEIVNYYHRVSNTKCINLRLSNGYGSPVFHENNCWWLVINELCKSAYHNSKIVITSDGSPQRDFIHIHDISRAVDLLLSYNSNFKKNTFHLASGNTLTILELAHKVRMIYLERYKKEIPVYLPDNAISESCEATQHNPKFHVDISRIGKLGFRTEMDLKMGINEIFDYIEKN